MFYDHFIRRLLAPGLARGPCAALSILLFHRVLPHPDPLFPGEVDVVRFNSIVSWLTDWCQLLPLQEAVDRLSTQSLPPRAACITFDDGYADNHTYALPILKRHGAPATFFIATGFLNGGRMWNDTVIEAVRNSPHSTVDLSASGFGTLATNTNADKREAIKILINRFKYRDHPERARLAELIGEQCEAPLPDDLMMSDDQVRDLHIAGMGIGAHTVDHPIFARCNDQEARQQIIGSREYLEALLKDRVTLFAYPNGKPGIDYTADQARMVGNLGFTAAVSTAPGASRFGDDIFQLRRFTPWDRSRLRFGIRLALNLRR